MIVSVTISGCDITEYQLHPSLLLNCASLMRQLVSPRDPVTSPAPKPPAVCVGAWKLCVEFAREHCNDSSNHLATASVAPSTPDTQISCSPPTGLTRLPPTFCTPSSRGQSRTGEVPYFPPARFSMVPRRVIPYLSSRPPPTRRRSHPIPTPHRSLHLVSRIAH